MLTIWSNSFAKAYISQPNKVSSNTWGMILSPFFLAKNIVDNPIVTVWSDKKDTCIDSAVL